MKALKILSVLPISCLLCGCSILNIFNGSGFASKGEEVDYSTFNKQKRRIDNEFHNTVFPSFVYESKVTTNAEQKTKFSLFNTDKTTGKSTSKVSAKYNDNNIVLHKTTSYVAESKAKRHDVEGTEKIKGDSDYYYQYDGEYVYTINAEDKNYYYSDRDQVTASYARYLVQYQVLREFGNEFDSLFSTGTKTGEIKYYINNLTLTMTNSYEEKLDGADYLEITNALEETTQLKYSDNRISIVRKSEEKYVYEYLEDHGIYKKGMKTYSTSTTKEETTLVCKNVNLKPVDLSKYEN